MASPLSCSKANVARFDGRPGRIISVGGVRWKWRVGSRSGVVAYSERGERLCARAHEVKGVPAEVFERGRWKRTSDGSVTPSEVADWMRREVEESKWHRVR